MSARPALPLFLPLLVWLSFVVACSSDAATGGAGGAGGAGATYTCDNRGIESRCFDYPAGITKSEVDATCDGEVVEGACTRDKAVATCVMVGMNEPYKGLELVGIYYSDGPTPWTASTAEPNCAKTNGTFEAL